MSAESSWLGVAIGIAVGMFAWVVGLGPLLWPGHPQWALFLIVVGAGIVSMLMLERKERHSRQAHTLTR